MAAFTVAAAEPPAPVRQIGDEVTAVRRSTDIVPFALLKNEERMPRGTQAEPPREPDSVLRFVCITSVALTARRD